MIKHELIGLTKYIATYWPEKKVTCNALSSGGIFNNQGSDFFKKGLKTYTYAKDGIQR